MGIYTIGDLHCTTEQQLLSSKNFGETSLVEIRECSPPKGFLSGSSQTSQRDPDPPLDSYLACRLIKQAVLERPISELNLSVRARKCISLGH